MGMWKQRWEICRDKLREIKPEPELWIDMGKYFRRDEVVIRLGHILLTHGYLMYHLIVNFVMMPSCLLNTL